MTDEQCAPRHAEIAGGGIAGLTLGALLAGDGWSVRVHEQSSAIRELGAGLYMRNNSMRVLENLGADVELKKTSLEITESEFRNGEGRLLSHVEHVGVNRLWMSPRQDLIRALEHAALERGVDIRLGSQITAASPEGFLVNSAGERFSGDLVVGADGGKSPVRSALGLDGVHRQLPSIATRFLLDHRRFELRARTTMYWSGRRRIGITACSPTQTYVFLIAHQKDTTGIAQPLDVDSWTASFPVHAELFAELHAETPLQHNYHLVRTPRWSSGRAAIVGDAAHGLPPLLGQGAGLAMANSQALAQTLSTSSEPIPSALQAWEREYRSFTDITQAWSSRLDNITNHWPRPLYFARNRMLWGITSIPFVRNRMRIADRFPLPARQPG